MRIAVQQPHFLFADQQRNFDGYNFAFLRQFRPLLFLPNWKSRLTRGWKVKGKLAQAGLDPDDFEICHTVKELNKKADVLVCFNQAACLPVNAPPPDFRGLKVWHLMDFNYLASECSKALIDGGVSHVMAYSRLDRDCGFLRSFYPQFIDKLIPVPFGFGERFQDLVLFSSREMRAVVMGAVNPSDQGRGAVDWVLGEYAAYYADFPYSQMWRHTLRKDKDNLTDVLDCFLPEPPQISRPTDDPVSLLNKYVLYVNDESICGFPPARTYEGAACGAAMISSDHQCFKDLGFIDGENCVMHKPLDIEGFREKVRYYVDRPSELEAIARKGCEMVRSRYTHEAVARKLYRDIEALLK